MSTAARRHTISNTTQPMEVAMAMVDEEEAMEGLLFPSSCIVVSGGGNSVVSDSGGAVVLDGVGAVMMASGEQAALSP